MYDKNDPRGALATTPSTTIDPDTPMAPAQFFEFDGTAPDEVTPGGSEQWIVRAQNLILVRTKLRPGDGLTADSSHEHVVIVGGPGDRVRISSSGETAELTGVGLAVVAAGASSLTAIGKDGGGAEATDDTVDIVRLFDVRDTALAERARNRSAYATPDPRVTPVTPWPAPTSSRPIRIYRTDDFPSEPGRFGTMFRTSSFMINFIDPQQGPRDPEKLSPHHHDDFEQVSLAVEGAWTHHIRTPWTPRKSRWRDDEHVELGSPSVAIIPPPSVHTSEASGGGLNRLVDIFSPPRDDFSRKPGWVLNADEYPDRPGLADS